MYAELRARTGALGGFYALGVTGSSASQEERAYLTNSQQLIELLNFKPLICKSCEKVLYYYSTKVRILSLISVSSRAKVSHVGLPRKC